MMNNLRYLIAFVCLLLTAVTERGIAQADESRDGINSSEARRKFIFGFKGGFNRSNVYAQERHNFDPDGKMGAVAGIFFCIPFGDFIGFQPEILFSQKGFAAAGEIEGVSYALSRTSNHLDVPFQLQMKPFSWLSTLMGLQYSYVISQRDDFAIDSNSDKVHQQFNGDVIRQNLIGIVMGADINFWHIVISGRAGWDLLNNQKDANAVTPRYKNLWFQGTLGYRIY